MSPQARHFLRAFALGLGSAPIIFALAMAGLIGYAYWRYPDPGSMTFFWAFFAALPYAGVGGLVVFVLALARRVSIGA